MLKTRTLLVDSIQTRYVDEGNGDALILIHGFPETLQGWRKNVPELAKHHRVVALDVVGFGQSDKADWDYSCRGLAFFVKKFLDRLSIQRVHLVGGDTGALIALAFAAEYRQQVDRVVFFSGTVSPEGISALDVKLMALPLIGDIGFLLFGSLGLRTGVKRGFYRPEQIENEVMQEYLDALSTWKARKIALRLMRVLGNGWQEVMKRLQVNPPPTLILWAEHEKYFYPWVPEKLKKDLAGSRLEYIKDSGHFIQEEKPEVFNRLVLDFLRQR